MEEPRGTAAALGEGDVFMHSHSEHSTGGHWCAKVIFFSLLTVLITLIGLIILENRGLTECEYCQMIFSWGFHYSFNNNPLIKIIVKWIDVVYKWQSN